MRVPTNVEGAVDEQGVGRRNMGNSIKTIIYLMVRNGIKEYNYVKG